METNNLTPDENLKEPIYFNKDEEPVKIYDTVEAPGIVYTESNYDDFADTGAGVIVLLFTSIFILVVAAILFCLMYFK